MRKKPKISVAIVCLNEERNIGPCLDSLLKQSYSPKLFEILVVDNGSTDGTIPMIEKYQKRSGRIKLILNPKRGIAISRNMAVKKARYRLLAFIDADCVAPETWLKNLVEGYLSYLEKDNQVTAVGGANYPPRTSSFRIALGLMLNTYLGSRGSVQARNYLKDRYVPHLSCSNVLFSKRRIKLVGGFDKRFGSIIEDEDLTYRLSKKGYRFVYLARVAVLHKISRDFQGWTKKMFTYGKGRMWFLKKHPEKWSLLFLIPIVLVLGFPVLIWPYLVIIFFYSFGVSLFNRKLNLIGYLIGLYFITHYVYGLGEIYGFFKKRPGDK